MSHLQLDHAAMKAPSIIGIFFLFLDSNHCYFCSVASSLPYIPNNRSGIGILICPLVIKEETHARNYYIGLLVTLHTCNA